ncbi:unnamed protein product [Ilex paraguariensis]|uniref:Uncharacterized protein n=1 Tax=Ilex paraguariensis TaxID=185542 RepID=A0ABC8SFR3_9AQUA
MARLYLLHGIVKLQLFSDLSCCLLYVVIQGNCSKLSSSFVDDRIQYSVGIDKRENHSGYKESSIVGNESCDILKSWESDSSNGVIARPSCMISQIPMLAGHSQGTESTTPGGFVSSQKDDRICSHKKISAKYEHCDAQHPLSGCQKTSLASDLSTVLNVKVEPLDKTEVQSPDKNAVGNFSCSNIGPAESELELPDETYEDIFDHMVLRDRMMLLASRKPPCLQSSGNFECSGKGVPSFLDGRPIESDCAKPLRINRLRKRRKTATDSVQTALEEDAPGLLQVLIDKGVSVNEIKLYGEMESENALDDSSTEDSFTELEAVIAKLFSQRHSLLKFASLRCPKDEKASYCLACLISLVEQAHYLQFKKWPVEWGWCRDLQSFVFVFERHNRIVLERPEYGYATYFFELVDSLTISWQVKRLVTAMKLTSCSRATLIENKALVVGEDLSEGEARVLTQYGWIPNSGLGTMLNYCDRVVHDRKNESDSSEWRSKIGKLLMDGYNGGTIVSTDIPIKVVEYGVAQSPQIKLEL